ncbi:MAG: hypothetical protein QXR16_02250 [Candidatus Micrarchaeaceae archaeon]
MRAVRLAPSLREQERRFGNGIVFFAMRIASVHLSKIGLAYYDVDRKDLVDKLRKIGARFVGKHIIKRAIFSCLLKEL